MPATVCKEPAGIALERPCVKGTVKTTTIRVNGTEEAASKDRIVPGSFKLPSGVFPPSSTSLVDPDEVSSLLVQQLNKAIQSNDKQAIGQVFHENSYWRDHLCLGWDLRTLKSRERIAQYVVDSINLTSIDIDRTTTFRAPKHGPIDGIYGAASSVSGIEFFINVDTKVGSGRGVIKLAEVDGQWKIFTVFSTLQELKNHEERVGHRRPNGAAHGEHIGRQNWQDRRNISKEYENHEPTVLIVGAGQSGLTTAARLKALDVDALVIDHQQSTGDNWRRRYRQLVLHDPVWLNHLPYLPFPTTWPVFTPKDKLAEFFEAYVNLLELNVWNKTRVVHTSWESDEKRWTVVLHRQRDDGVTETRVVHPSHIIQATGHAGPKHMPSIPGMETVKGSISHSTEFSNAKPNGHGKKAVVVGSSNSAHDIAQDFYEQGYDVTMFQRSSTLVLSSKFRNSVGLKGLYVENSPPIEDADLLIWGLPIELFKTQQIKVCELQNIHDKELLDGLTRVGFKLDRGIDDAGYTMKYLHRGGGYYVDVGASQLVIDGKIKLKQGVEISKIGPNGTYFNDGSYLEADEIVFATGFQNMRTQTRVIFGDKVADRVRDVWGFDQEGEMRTIWRYTGHPGFWFMGTNFAHCRYYSRIVALQIKAIQEGLAPLQS
ncbi:hypothetical protein FDECE_12044 [Fusarium decemcellulare]|nr:hypothetical protein FDECE_12044 [Fusarium decemcellulare]